MSSSQYVNFPYYYGRCRLASVTNIAGTYFNGIGNNGVAATLTVAASSLTIDSVASVVGDSVVLAGQTTAAQNGIYQVTSIGSTVVLTRRTDMQCNEQLISGGYVFITSGTIYAGSCFAVIDPLPSKLGLSALSIISTATISALPSTAGQVAVYSNTAGALVGNNGLIINSNNNVQLLKGTDITAATNVSLPTGNYFTIDGTTAINTISAAGIRAGTVIYFQFSSAGTVMVNLGTGSGALLQMSGGANLTSTQNQIIGLIYQGVYWFQISSISFV